MDIKNKRIGFMFNILVAIFTAIIMNDRTGLYVSTLIIIVPFIVWFILRNLLLIVVYTVVIIKGLCVM